MRQIVALNVAIPPWRRGDEEDWKSSGGIAGLDRGDPLESRRLPSGIIPRGALGAGLATDRRLPDFSSDSRLVAGSGGGKVPPTAPACVDLQSTGPAWTNAPSGDIVPRRGGGLDTTNQVCYRIPHEANEPDAGREGVEY